MSVPLAWVYDLFRRSEPYGARPPHPTGVGIQRPVAWSDLSGEEQDYLQRQQLLSLINFANPFAFFPHHLGGERWQANLMAQHTLTSFGYSVDLRPLPWLAVSPRLIAWLQPEGQQFATQSAQAGVLASALVRPGSASRASAGRSPCASRPR